MKSPFEGGQFRVTSIIGMRTIAGVTGPHYGLDIVGMSSKRIMAIAAGTVARSTMLDKATDKSLTWEWGNYVRVDGDDGCLYYYCHMSQRLVNVGQHVEVGDVLGIEGYTGYVVPQGPGGSHLHIEMRKGSQQCVLPAQANDPCNVATHIGITNAVGVYNAQVEPIAALDDDEYIRRIVAKVGYGDAKQAVWALGMVRHADRNAFFKKMYEALK